MITKSYMAWQESPITTTIMTHPLDDLHLPSVTICPPKGSNTALNYDLLQASNLSFSEKAREDLKSEVFRHFIRRIHIDHASLLLTTVETSDLRKVFAGHQTMPRQYGSNGLEVISESRKGSVQTPNFRGHYDEAAFRDSRTFRFSLDTRNLLLESGSLLIEIEVETQDEIGWNDKVVFSEGSHFKLHNKKITWYAAEEHCQADGGHLASVLSEQELLEVNRLTNGTASQHSALWLGGEEGTDGVWRWTDGSEIAGEKLWQKKGYGPYCSAIYHSEWQRRGCTYERPFVCQHHSGHLRGSTIKRFVYTKENMPIPSFQVWHKYKKVSQERLDSWKEKRMTGFRISWKVDKPNSETTKTDTNEGSGQKPDTKEPQYLDQNLRQLVMLASFARTANISKQELFVGALKTKVEQTKGQKCSAVQKAVNNTQLIEQIGNMSKSSTTGNLNPTDEDIETGLRLHFFLSYCNEATNIGVFLFDLVSSEAPSTILQATINTLQSGNVRSWLGKQMMVDFYRQLDKLFHLRLGKILLEISSLQQLEAMLAQGAPYLDAYRDEISRCVKENDCQELVRFSSPGSDFKRIHQTIIGKELAAMSVHPAMLTDVNSRSIVSALVPYCAYRGFMNDTGEYIPGTSFPICNKFYPAIRDGELCYALNNTFLEDGKQKTEPGKGNGLLLAVDLGMPVGTHAEIPDNSRRIGVLRTQVNKERNSFVFHISSLQRHSDHRFGRYKLSALKKMTATDDFLRMDDNVKKCQIGSQEKCRNDFFVEEILKVCGCIPWRITPALAHLKVGVKKNLPHCQCLSPRPLSTAVLMRVLASTQLSAPHQDV